MMETKKRLIDADLLVCNIDHRYCKPCEEKHEDYNHVRCRACWVDDMVGELETAHTVDAVEVVRCGKCKWYDPDSEYCQFWHGVRHPGHYCGEGDVKDNG